jgi:nucleotide-binding universal stress UspA family protein
LASFYEADLTALYVINTRAMEDLLRARIFLKDEQVEYEHDMESDAERYLNYVNELAVQKGVALTARSSRGNVHKEIVNAIKDGDIDLLVIGELSRIRSRRDEFYDEAERAMRAAPCSVLIVKDDDKVWEMYESLG